MKNKIISIIILLIILVTNFLSTISWANEEINEGKTEEIVDINNNNNEKKEEEQQEIVEEDNIQLNQEETEKKPEQSNSKELETEPKQDQSTPKDELEAPKLEEKEKEEQKESIEKEEKQEEQLNTINSEFKISTPILEEGIYEIYSGVGETRVLDIYGQNKNDSTNVEIYERLNQNNQKFKVKLNNDGTYTFFAMHSNKVLDVSGNGKKNETNVIQYSYHNADNQKWYIEDSGKGYYYIKSKSSGLYLDVYRCENKNGQNVQIYTKNGGTSQRFTFVKVVTSGTKTLENGIYNIYSKVADNRLLEVSNNETRNEAEIITSTNNNLANQRFQFTYNNDGTYTITALHSGKVLDVRYGSGQNKSVVQQYEKHSGDIQKWIITKNSNDTYSIISKCNGLALNISNGSTQTGAKVQTYKINGSKSQQFSITKVSKTEVGSKTQEDGTYRILSYINNKKLIQLGGNTSSNSAEIEMWDNTNTLQQKYEITYTGDGYYKIKSKKSNKVLTVENQNPKVGSTIKQSEDTNLDTQKWILKKYGESLYAIISKCGNLYLTLTDSNIKNGQKLKLQSQTDLDNQRFIFVNEAPKDDANISNGIYQIVTKGNKVLDVSGESQQNSANVLIWNNQQSQNQKFQITKIENTNYYKIIAIHSQKSLDVQQANKNCGANVMQYDYTNKTTQQWLIKDCGNGYYNIISKDSGLYLDVTGVGINVAGTNMELWYNNGGDAQKFKLLRTNIINNDSYRITSQLDVNKYVNVYNNSQGENVNIQLDKKTSDNSQIFRVESLDNINYKIIARHSNKILTVLDNNNVVQATDKNSSNQLWTIEKVENNYYKIKSKANNLYLCVKGTNLEVAKEQKTSAQNFKFNNLEQKKGIDVSEFNGLINWEFVKRSGIDYAIIRVGYRGYRTGAFAEDKYFKQNILGAKRAGLKVGIYFYTQAVNEKEAIEEANWIVNKIKQVGYEGRIEYPIVIDTEMSGGNPPGRADTLDVGTRTKVCKAFCETIKSKGYKPMIYASKNWFYNNLNVQELNQYNIWLAHYTYSPTKLSDYKYHYEIWQYTSLGQVMGVQGNVDMDICYQSY